MSTLLTIDGSFGEGGGQIIRTALALSAITGRSMEIARVRAGRSRPGLQPQHLAAVRAAAELCAADLRGAERGSTQFRFEPRSPVTPGSYRFDIGTAGAATLVAQTVLAPLALTEGDSRVTVIGGTHVPYAPPADYMERVYTSALAHASWTARFDYARAGFFPRGGGEIELKIRGGSDRAPFDLTERGKLLALTATVVTSGLPEHVAQRGAQTIETYMKGIGRKVETVVRDLPSPGQGAAVVLSAECEGGRAGFSALGERGKPMEKVALAPCEQFLAWWKTGAAVDEHLADQLVLPAALTAGESRWTTPAVTEHLRTVLWLVEQFLDMRWSVEERAEAAVVTVSGGRAQQIGS